MVSKIDFSERGWNVLPAFVTGTGLSTDMIEQLALHPESDGESSWGTRNMLFGTVLSLRPKVVLEIGAHIGSSSLVMGHALKMNNFGTLYCLEPADHCFSILSDFVDKAGLADFVRPLKMFSTDPALTSFIGKSVDLIFLDANHSYSAALKDIALSDELLSENGLLFLDDVGHEQSPKMCTEGRGGVRQALLDYTAGRDDLKVIFFEHPFWLNPCGMAIVCKQSIAPGKGNSVSKQFVPGLPATEAETERFSAGESQLLRRFIAQQGRATRDLGLVERIGRLPLLMRARSAARRGNWPRAEAKYKRLLSIYGDDPKIWIQYGHAVKEQGDLLAALGAYKRALEVEPNHAEAYLQLGHALKLLGRFSDAEAAYQHAFTLRPDIVEAQPGAATWDKLAPRPVLRAQASRSGGNYVEWPGRNLNFILSHDVPELKTGDIFDTAKVISELSELRRPPANRPDAVSEYNRRYLTSYKKYDASTEFHDAVALGTFDDNLLMPSFDDLTEVYPDHEVPFLDQTSVSHQYLSAHQRYWADNGYLVVKGMIDPDVCDEYIRLREKLELGANRFPTFTPYVEHDVFKRIFCSPEMNMLINDLVGEELGLHFNLTPFVSTERGWHQDEYLNPPQTFGRYIAAWVAVDDVPEASGPFEFIRGSHKLPTVSREKVMPFLKEEFRLGHSDNYDWSVHSAMFVSPAYFYKFASERRPVTKFLGKKGDVLLWHSRLIHRGSPPANRNLLRPGIIGHYSPIRTARWFGQDIRRFRDGGYYWHFDP